MSYILEDIKLAAKADLQWHRMKGASLNPYSRRDLRLEWYRGYADEPCSGAFGKDASGTLLDNPLWRAWRRGNMVRELEAMEGGHEMKRKPEDRYELQTRRESLKRWCGAIAMACAIAILVMLVVSVVLNILGVIGG